MHEWALAEAVLQSVRDNIKEQENAAITSVELLFGELQDINEEAFMAGIEELSGEYSIPSSVFHIRTERAEFQCRNCGREWGMEAAGKLTEDDREAIHFLPEAGRAYMQCPACGSPDFSVIRGRGVVINRIELEAGE